MAIDCTVIVASMTDDPDTIAECAAEFVPFARADVAAIAAAAKARDAETLWQMSHRLKGGSALFGAGTLKQTCSALESAARESDWKTIGDLVPKLEPLLTDVERAIFAFIQQLRSA